MRSLVPAAGVFVFTAGCSSSTPIQGIRLSGTEAIEPAAIRAFAADCADVDDCRWWVSQKYLEEGYVSAAIVFEQSFLERWMGSKGGTFVIVEGPRYTLGPLTFQELKPPGGDTLGDPAALSSLTPLREGNTFRTEEIRTHIRAIETRYAAAGYEANVVPVTTIDANAHTVSIAFEVERGPLTSKPN